jgi:hypothetical protein
MYQDITEKSLKKVLFVICQFVYIRFMPRLLLRHLHYVMI